MQKFLILFFFLSYCYLVVDKFYFKGSIETRIWTFIWTFIKPLLIKCRIIETKTPPSEQCKAGGYIVLNHYHSAPSIKTIQPYYTDTKTEQGQKQEPEDELCSDDFEFEYEQPQIEEVFCVSTPNCEFASEGITIDKLQHYFNALSNNEPLETNEFKDVFAIHNQLLGTKLSDDILELHPSIVHRLNDLFLSHYNN